VAAATPPPAFDMCTIHVLDSTGSGPRALDLLLGLLVLDPRLHADDFGMEKQVVLEDWPQKRRPA